MIYVCQSELAKSNAALCVQRSLCDQLEDIVKQLIQEVRLQQPTAASIADRLFKVAARLESGRSEPEPASGSNDCLGSQAQVHGSRGPRLPGPNSML